MIILGTNSIKDTGFDVANSLRFNDGSSDTLSINMSTSANRRTFTFSTWVKKTKLTGSMNLLGTGGSSDQNHLQYESSPLTFRHYNGSANDIRVSTSRQFRDPSAWHHIILAVDTTQGTAANRVKIYVNGVQETSFQEATYPNQNYDWDFFQNGSTTYIGRRGHSDSVHFDGYLAETVFIDGQQLAADQFGEFDEDSGIWKPIDVSGLTFGNAGFYLDFEDSSALGNDVSGNNNDFTVNNLTAIDQTTDTCTNNFATMNPLAYRLDSGVSLPTYSEGNCKVVLADDSGAAKSSMGTIGVSTGKWYWEMKLTTDNDAAYCGITRAEYDPNDNFAGRSIYYNSGDGALSVGTGTGGTADGSYGNTYTSGDIVGVAFDATNGVIWFSKNGTWQNSATIAEIGAGTTTNAATTGITMSQTWMPFLEGADCTWEVNFGNPTFSISSGNTDGDGYGNFEYAVPSGYFAINTKNLAEYG